MSFQLYFQSLNQLPIVINEGSLPANNRHILIPENSCFLFTVQECAFQCANGRQAIAAQSTSIPCIKKEIKQFLLPRVTSIEANLVEPSYQYSMHSKQMGQYTASAPRKWLNVGAHNGGGTPTSDLSEQISRRGQGAHWI